MGEGAHPAGRPTRPTQMVTRKLNRNSQEHAYTGRRSAAGRPADCARSPERARAGAPCRDFRSAALRVVNVRRYGHALGAAPNPAAAAAAADINFRDKPLRSEATHSGMAAVGGFGVDLHRNPREALWSQACRGRGSRV